MQGGPHPTRLPNKMPNGLRRAGDCSKSVSAIISVLAAASIYYVNSVMREKLGLSSKFVISKGWVYCKDAFDSRLILSGVDNPRNHQDIL